MKIEYTRTEGGGWLVDGYPYINLKKHLFEDTRWTENFINSIGKVVTREVHRNILRGENKILIVIQDKDNNSSEQTKIGEEG